MKSARADQIVVRRVVAAPPERVFRVWTDPVFAARWSWGPQHDTLAVSIDCTRGGAWHHQIRNRDTGEVWTFRGVFREVLPGRRIVHTFFWKSDDGTEEGESLVEIDFLENQKGTEVVITHSALTGDKQAEGTIQGWNEVLDCIAQCVE